MKKFLFCFLLIFSYVSLYAQPLKDMPSDTPAPKETPKPQDAPTPKDTSPQETPNPDIPKQEEPDFAETRPRVKNRDELTVTFSKGDLELDFRKSYMASEAQLYTAIYEGLFSYHPITLEPVPALAEKWELSNDKKQWTFTLRGNAKYWNGDPVTAEDFRTAWLSVLAPERDAPYSSLYDIIEGAKEYRTGEIRDENKVGIIASGPKTLVVKLIAPASFFPSMLSHHSFSPIHPSMLKVDDWTASPPVSNGPFRIAEMEENNIVLEKTDNYWDAKNVSLNKINVRFTETGEEASRLWNSGEARWISGDVDIDALTDRSGIQVNPMFATHYYFIRSGEKPWNDYRLRRALILVLPWDEIRSGHYHPAKTLIYPLPGYPKIEGLSETSTDEAVALLAEAGFPEGKGLPELVLRITPSPEASRITGLMAVAWKEQLGIPVRVEIVPYSRYFQALKAGGYNVGYSTWIGDFADPYSFLQMWRRDSNLNDSGYNDDDYEALMEKSMLEEGSARWAILAEAEQLLLERGSVLPISFSPAINIVDMGELEGWFPNALDIHPFKYLAFRAFRPIPGVVMHTKEQRTGNR
ncbi:MAG: ABC transporter substrate-binding protein [Treponema sp.]|jgi:peptide/nickel transport system substrate-binding protein/oligopeptide transport system substrate-binding protein|nr:ABC transporter substrate-binding protein [Treponema sp.]